MILLIDNYDSFSYNLYQLLGSVDNNINVLRNDKIIIDEIKKLNPNYIVISPGPGRPEDAGISIDVVKEFYNKIPILGVCLGHQAIYEAFGGKITYAKELMHGKSSEILIESDDSIFDGLDKNITVGRYHSLSVDVNTLSEDLKILARSDDEIMAIAHKKYPVYGLQFHPESILTPDGSIIIKNFLNKNINSKIINDTTNPIARPNDFTPKAPNIKVKIIGNIIGISKSNSVIFFLSNANFDFFFASILI